MRAGLTTLVLTAAIAFAAVAPAALGDGGEKSKIKITKLSANGAKGKVTSKAHSCEGGKKVSLFRFDDYVSVKISITKSNSSGAWRVKKDLKPGKYFAKVDAIRVGGTRCLYDVSKNRRI